MPKAAMFSGVIMFGGGIVEASQSHGLALQDTDKVALLISSPHFIGCQRGMPYSFPVHHKIKTVFPPKVRIN